MDVFDIAPSSVKDVTKFQSNLKNNSNVSELIPYPTDPGIHIIINQ